MGASSDTASKPDNVVSISGGKVTRPGNPDPFVIADIKDLLERAEAGELVGCIFGSLWADGTSNGRFVGTASDALIGTTHRAVHRCNNALNAQDAGEE